MLGFVTDPSQALADQRLQEDPVEHETGDVEAGMAEADAIVEAEYGTSAQVHHALEPHCGVAQWLGDELHAFVSTQGIWDARAELARAFDLDPDRVHVTCEFMGGGFGAKQGATTEGMIAAYLSRASAGRAVRVFNDRRAEGVAAGHRSPDLPAELPHRRAPRRDADGDRGHLRRRQPACAGGSTRPRRRLARSTAAPTCARRRSRCCSTSSRSNAFRAPGIMEGTFGYESALDELAAALSIDPLDLRRANDVDVDQVSGLPYTAKNLEACIDRAAELAGWTERDALRDREHPDGRKRGLGAACQIWWGGGGPPAHALVRMGHDGVVTVVTGAQDIGTGVTTAFAQVAAEELGLPLDRVRVEVGSTRYGVYAPVSGGSQTMPSVAPAVRSAAYDLRGKLLELAGDVFEVAPDDLQIVDGSFVSLDGALREPIVEVTGKLGKAQLVGTGSRGPNPDGMRVNTFGCQIAQVAVDVATGEITVERIVAVHDIGRVIAPLQARSQVEGGVLQGLGFALMEERVIDPTTGTVVNAQPRGLQAADARRLPRDRRRVHRPARSARLHARPQGPGRAADRAHRAGDRQRGLPRDRRARAHLADHAAAASWRRAPDERLRPPRVPRRGARAARRARRAAARRRHRPDPPAVARQGRGHARRRARAARRHDRGAGRRARDRRCDPRGRRGRRRESGRALRRAGPGRGPGRLAAAAQSGHGRGQPGTARALLVLPASRPDLLAGGRRHLLRADRRPPQARPRGRRLHLRGSLGPRRAPSWRSTRRCASRALRGERIVPIAELYGRPSEGHRSSVQLARGELITAVELPAPPDASAYERAGERAAWSFALTGIAAARFGQKLRLAAIGLTNEPRLLDPADPLAGLPGLEQTGWKRELAGVLCERALARVAPR